MGQRRALRAALMVTAPTGVVLVWLFGCAMIPPNSLIDPTKVGRFALETREGGIRRVLTPRDTPPGLAHATEPTPEDLVAVFEDYRFEPGDTVAVTIDGLLQAGQPWGAALEINPLGEIRIPDLGSIRVTGMTEQELEQELIARLQESGLLPKPIVVVFTQQRRGRMFTVMGAVGGPGPYPITRSDLRLLEAFGMVGDVSAMSRKAYVIRGSAAGGSAAPLESVPAPEEVDGDYVIPPPVDQEEPQGGFMSAGGMNVRRQQEEAEETSPPTRQDLEAVLTPQSQPAAADTGPAEQEKPAFEPLVFDPETGEVRRLESRAAAQAEAPSEAVEEARPRAEALEEPFDWDEVDEYEFEQRVIEISIPELKNGNPRYNIVLRNRDVINVPIDTGVFYMMGEVNRPGVYAFGGREITIKQALAIVGGFSPMAWPQRCEIIRRESGTDKQLTIPVNLDAIFYGLEDDFYLRDDDIVNVGTHIVAPFLYVIRNSFRFTYGFGFVYDRNFADKDAYSSRINPEVLEQQRRAQRGLSF